MLNAHIPNVRAKLAGSSIYVKNKPSIRLQTILLTLFRVSLDDQMTCLECEHNLHTTCLPVLVWALFKPMGSCAVESFLMSLQYILETCTRGTTALDITQLL